MNLYAQNHLYYKIEGLVFPVFLNLHSPSTFDEECMLELGMALRKIVVDEMSKGNTYDVYDGIKIKFKYRFKKTYPRYSLMLKRKQSNFNKENRKKENKNNDDDDTTTTKTSTPIILSDSEKDEKDQNNNVLIEEHSNGNEGDEKSDENKNSDNDNSPIDSKSEKVVKKSYDYHSDDFLESQESEEDDESVDDNDDNWVDITLFQEEINPENENSNKGNENEDGDDQNSTTTSTPYFRGGYKGYSVNQPTIIISTMTVDATNNSQSSKNGKMISKYFLPNSNGGGGFGTSKIAGTTLLKVKTPKKNKKGKSSSLIKQRKT